MTHAELMMQIYLISEKLNFQAVITICEVIGGLRWCVLNGNKNW